MQLKLRRQLCKPDFCHSISTIICFAEQVRGVTQYVEKTPNPAMERTYFHRTYTS